MLAFGASAVEAACIPTTDPRLSQYETLLRVDAIAAERQAANELKQRTLSAHERASLYAILAEVHSIQEKHDDAALAIVERVRTGAADIRGGALPPDFTVTLSAGIATNQTKNGGLEDIIAQADAALYIAKHRGRNLVQVAQESYDASPATVRKTLHAAGVDLKTGKFQIAS